MAGPTRFQVDRFQNDRFQIDSSALIIGGESSIADNFVEDRHGRLRGHRPRRHLAAPPIISKEVRAEMRRAALRDALSLAPKIIKLRRVIGRRLAQNQQLRNAA